MTAQQYERWTKKIRESRYGVEFLRRTVKGITGVAAASYVLLLFVFLLRQQWEALYQSILVPGVSFAAVSVFRNCSSYRRPYEELDIEPLLHKETRGKSFPSRHVFSIAIIATTFFRVNGAMGAALWALTFLLAALRVLGGVHYVRDVAAGAAMGALCGVIGYYVIF